MKKSLKILLVTASALNLIIAIYAVTAVMGFTISPAYLAFEAAHSRFLKSVNLIVLIFSFVLVLLAMRQRKYRMADLNSHNQE